MKKILTFVIGLLIILIFMVCNPEKEARGASGEIEGNCENIKSLNLLKKGIVSWDCDEKVFWMNRTFKFTEESQFTLIIKTKDGREYKKRLEGSIGVKMQAGSLGTIKIPEEEETPSREVMFCVPIDSGVIPYSEMALVEQKIDNEWVTVDKTMGDANSLKIRISENTDIAEVRLTYGRARTDSKTVNIDLGGGCEKTGEGIYYYIPNAKRGLCFKNYEEYSGYFDDFIKEEPDEDVDSSSSETDEDNPNKEEDKEASKTKRKGGTTTKEEDSNNKPSHSDGISCTELKVKSSKLVTELENIKNKMDENKQSVKTTFDEKKAATLGQLVVDSLNKELQIVRIKKLLKRKKC